MVSHRYHSTPTIPHIMGALAWNVKELSCMILVISAIFHAHQDMNFGAW